MDLPAPDTAVATADVAALLIHLRQLGWVADGAQIVSLGSPGAGNMNRTLRLRLSGSDRDSLILKQAVPFVAKYPDIAAPANRDLSEAAFYQALTADAQLAAQCPELIGHDVANHLLCFEDLGCQGDYTPLYASGAKPTALLSDFQTALPLLLSWLSRLHRLPVANSFPANLEMRKLNHEHIFVLPFTADKSQAEHPDVALWQRHFCNRQNAMQLIEALGQLYLGQQQNQQDQHESGNPPTLVQGAARALLHGDFYPASWLRADSAAHPVQIIDPEFGFVGPPEFDLGIMSAHLTFAGWHDDPLPALLEHYAQPPGFSSTLAQQFCAVEVMRRLLGVAKLPLQADAATQIQWLEQAVRLLNGR